MLKTLPDECVDFIITSPPYANNRRHTYGGVPISTYVEWFLPVSAELKRVLRPRGSFILNIKERVHEGERATYVLELILAMKEQGWLWIDEYVWHKKNCYPGKWPNRFRDAWERCLHFTKQKQFDMYQEAVMVPVGGWAKKRLLNLSEADRTRTESKVLSGLGKNVSNWIGRQKVYPTNVLHLPTECSNRRHPATFPVALAAWFINLFTQEGDLVLDPFFGSGTTALACIDLNRHYFGIELMEPYYELALEAVAAKKGTAAKASRRGGDNGCDGSPPARAFLHPGVDLRRSKELAQVSKPVGTPFNLNVEFHSVSGPPERATKPVVKSG
jgi:site-specific DNA-methyltransferase (adenine-specific)/site-specific DNA-methyltransferase (cytosine-N4-specific)